MHKFLSASGKEALFLIRDLPGLAILFLMPLLLVLVVTLAQEHATNRNRKTPLLVADQAATPLSRRIISDIDSSNLFTITLLTPDSSHRTSDIEHRTSEVALLLAENDSLITLTFDPLMPPAEQRSLQSTLTFLIRGAQARQVMENTLDRMFPDTDTTLKMMVRGTLAEGMNGMPRIRCGYDLPERSEIRPSVIQNNVPGFILFAMFFIVIPLSASMISEKNEGAHTRLMTLPVPRSILLAAKVTVYLVVCMVQFLLMILMGTWLFPSVFGLEPLHIAGGYMAIAAVTAASALAAIGFGILTGTFARTMGQAALFGSVMVVILGLISGTFLPVHLMPEAIQWVSLCSPVRWGIDSYLILFVKGGGVADVLTRMMLLILFFSLAMIISIHIFAKRK